MDKKVIDDIVYYIPFKKLRNAVREYLTALAFKIEEKHQNFLITEESTHPVYLLRKQASLDTLEYISKNASDAVLFYDRYQLLEYIMNTYFKDKQEKYDNKIFLEFGVFSGDTINFCSYLVNNANFYGFDSFEGLPDDWNGYIYEKNAFDLKGILPKVNQNVSLIKGYFDKTLPIFFQEHKEDIAFVHVDCDLYSSTKVIFENIYDRINEDTIIVFDEYYNYPNWINHEFKAFQEFCAQYKVSYKYLCLSDQQVAVKLNNKPIY